MNYPILITGANGFIGKYLTAFLIKKGEFVIPISKHKGNINGVKVIPVDLTNLDEVSRFFKGKEFSTIFHLAAKIPLTSPEANNPDLAFENKKMTKAIIQFRNLNSLLVFASSSSIYHQIQTCYSKGQLKEEEICNKLNDIQFPSICFRISSPYGFGMHNTVLKIFVDKALRNEPLTIYGDGLRCQDFVHVSDIAEGMLLAHRIRTQGTYNLCSGKEITMLDLAQEVIISSGSKSKIEEKAIGQNRDRANYSIESTSNTFGYIPKITLSKGIRELCQDLKK